MRKHETRMNILKILSKARFFLGFVAIATFLFCAKCNISDAAVVDATLLFNPATVNEAAGNDFDVVMQVNPGSNTGGTHLGVNSAQLYITYDETVLQINSITVNSSTWTQVVNTHNDSDGTASVVVMTASPISASSNIATISFHAQGPATASQVAFTTLSDVSNADGDKLVATRTPATINISGTDTTAPVVTSFSISASYNNLTVPVTTFTATDAVGVTGYCLTEVNDSAGCSWSGTAQTSYTFSSAGAKTLYAWARDAIPNVSESVSDTVTIDTTVPTITSVSSDKAAGTYTVGEVIDVDVTFSEAVTSTGNVTVTLETGATDRTCTFTVSNATTGTCNYTVQAGDTSADLTTASIAGTIADAATNAMTNFTPATTMATNEAIVIDTTAPTGGSFTINDDDAEVGSLAVTLNVTCPTDSWATVQMAYGNSAAPTNWATCAATAAHTLTTGNGTKTVYMRFRDGGQNTTSDVTDTITLNIPDITAPVVSNGTPAGTLSSNTKTATISVATDENATCKFSTVAGTAYDAMAAFTTTGGTTHSFVTGSLDDNRSYAYYVKCVDGAGNITASDYTVSFSIKKKSSSNDDDKKKTSKRSISQSKSKIARGATLIQRGKKFSKKAPVLLYFSKPGGGYYAPTKIITSSSGAFTISYRVTKPKGSYGWYALDTVTNKKSKTKTYTVK